MRGQVALAALALASGCGGAAPNRSGVASAGAARGGESAPVLLSPDEEPEFLADGMHRTLVLRLAPGERRIVHTVTSRGVIDVDLVAYDDRGLAMASDRGDDASPRLLVDGGPEGGLVYVVASIHAGAGTVSIESLPLLGSEQDASTLPRSPSARGTLGHPPVPRGDLRLERSGLRAVRHEARHELEPGTDLRLGLRLEAGQCLGATASASPSTAVELSLIATDGRALARARGRDGEATLARCAERPEELALAVRAEAAATARLVIRTGEAAGVSGLDALLRETETTSLAP